MAGENFNDQYEDQAIYLPSLQQGYANFPFQDSKRVRGGNLPAGLKLSDLDFLNPASNLWHCKYVLYSAGQFDRAQIRTPDMITERKPGTVVIGDSGGYQIGTGKMKAVQQWRKFADKPDEIAKSWLLNVSIRDRILRWLDRYSDYAMTLDMPLWMLNEKRKAAASPFGKLSAEQLIELSVENLRYFADKRGAATGAKAKYLNVLQDAGNGTGEAWYAAVKDFDFEGWAFGGETRKGIEPILKWIRILLDDKKLDKAEWIHILMASPPTHSVYLTAIQQQLRKLLGTDIRVSYDSSSPFQSAGVRQQIAQQPTLTKELRSWTIKMRDFPQSPKYHSKENIEYLLGFPSPITQQLSINDLHSDRGEFAQKFLSSVAIQSLTNHNMFVYHKAAIDACDIVFKHEDHERIPAKVRDNLVLIEKYFL